MAVTPVNSEWLTFRFCQFILPFDAVHSLWIPKLKCSQLPRSVPPRP